MKKKTKIICCIIAVIVLIAAVVAGFWFANRKMAEKEFVQYMEDAEKYLADGDLEKAILEYEKAIETCNYESAAYEGIAQVYISMGDFNRAEYYLELGISRADSIGRLKYMLQHDLVEGPSNAELVETEEEEEEEEAVEYKVSGTVIDAVTGKGVEDAQIDVVPVSDNDPANDEQKSIDVKANGSYEIKLVNSKYIFVVSSDGYVTEEFEVIVKDKEIRQQNFTISPTLAAGEIRIVLEWGSYPRDLDAYAFRDSLSDSSPVWYANKGSDSKGAVLDVDDRDGYGPETITIKNTSGTWYYGVNDFTATGNGLGNSEATVKVYLPGEQPIIFTASGGSGNYWTVCKIKNGNVTAIDKIGDSFAN